MCLSIRESRAGDLGDGDGGKAGGEGVGGRP